MEKNYKKIFVDGVGAPLKVWSGHFATTHSHTNYYLDLTTLKARASEAHEIAIALQSHYLYDMVIDSIVCIEGTEVIGAYLAEELSKGGYLNTNAHKTIYIVKPEYDSNSQIIFRDNVRLMIKGKNALILAGNISTGQAIEHVVRAIQYYGGRISGISAVFSAIEKINNGMPVLSAFSLKDIPDYQFADLHACPMCQSGRPLDGLVNPYGISVL